MAEERFGGAELVVLEDGDAVAREAAQRIVAALSAAIDERGEAHIALAGGSTAASLYDALTELANRSAIDWSHVHLWWCDERFVPIDHPESNAGLAYRLLLKTGEDPRDGLSIDAQNVHPVEVEETLSESEPVELAAQLYTQRLGERLRLARGGLPRLDVILTGVGPDGHIMSVFAGGPGLAEDAPAAVAVRAPTHIEPQLARVSLSTRLLPVAGLVLVMVVGAAKQPVLGRIFGQEHSPTRWPGQTALLPNAVWLLDRAAAEGNT